MVELKHSFFQIVIFLLIFPSSSILKENLVKVIRVIDGDTVEIEGGDKIRLLYINTPEIGEEESDVATSFTKFFCLDKMVELKKGVIEKDKYGRILADIFVDGKSLSEALIMRGLAHLFLIPPFDKKIAEKYMKIQKQTKKEKKGIWNTPRFKGPLHITSFHANAKDDDRFNLNGEYLRIVNINDEDVNIEGFKLKNREGLTYIFPAVKIPVGYTIIIRSGEGENQVSYEKGQIELFWNSKRPIWANRGDEGILYDNKGNVVDRVEYKPSKRKR